MTRILVFTALLLGLAASGWAQQAPAAPAPGTGTAVGPNFVDANGDGICDLYQQGGQQGRRGAGAGAGKGYGPGNGTGNQGIGPRDGTGYGPGAASGNCNGTGQGRARRQGRR